MKKTIYLVMFVVLGVLIAFLAYAMIEVWYIDLLIKDFQKYSLGFSWNHWFLINRLLALIFFTGGIFAGYYQGIFWWKKIYEK